MRIWNLEVSWSPKTTDDARVWHMPPMKEKQLGKMKPNELRYYLGTIHQHLVKSNKDQLNTVEGSHRDKFQRIFLRDGRFRG